MSLRHVLFALTLISGAAIAGKQVVIAPDCLLAQTKTAANIMAAAKQMNLLRADAAFVEELITAKNNRVNQCGGFLDVTQDWKDYRNKSNPTAFLQDHSINPPEPLQTIYKIQHSKEVEQLLGQINPQLMWENLTTLSSYRDRYANSDDGVNAANWIRTEIMDYSRDAFRHDITAYFVKTGSMFKQPSLVIKIGNSEEPGIVVSAHMDTLSGANAVKPGADDDGSGSATILEAARAIIGSGMQFKKPLYFIWYAAEEEGLVGSGFVVRDFKKKNIPVAAVLHFDLTGYAHRNESTMWLITDNVDDQLTNYLGELITQYVKKPIKRTQCGYACSDHATWTQNGYAAAIPAEAAFENTNPNIHSSRDTIDKLSLEHMTDYTKLAVAFAVELAEPRG